MNDGMTVEFDMHFKRGNKGRRQARPGTEPPAPDVSAGAVPRITRLMALAIRFDDLVRRGEVADYADIARLGHVTRARVTQIMNLLNLAADIQEELLNLPLTAGGRDPIGERDLRPIAAETDWRKQRSRWLELRALRFRPPAG